MTLASLLSPLPNLKCNYQIKKKEGTSIINIGKFHQLIEENFNIKEWERKVQDTRKRPIIHPKTIFKLVREMVFLKQKSLLEVDEFAKKPCGLAWHKSKRKMVASDTTIERSLEGFNIEILQEILADAYKSLDKVKAVYKVLPSGGKRRVGIVDGTNFGGLSNVVFISAGMVNSPIDIEPYSQGKELVSARKLLSRVKKNLGEGGVDIILGDGLYISKSDILQCKKEIGSEVLIKTEEDRLDIIKDAKGIFFRMDLVMGDGIERVEGMDTSRGVEYRIIAGSGFEWQGLPFEFKVAHVWEREIKPMKGRAEIKEFWVVTTDTDLSGEDMRELAYFRWEIENNTFKRLNHLVGSKRGYIRNEKVKRVLLLIWFVGLILFGFCMMMRGLEGKENTKETWRAIATEFYDFILLSYGDNSS